MSDSISLIRTVGALLVVLGILAAALWATRRFNLALPGTAFVRAEKRLAIVERVNLDPRRSLALLRHDGVEHLLLLAPEGNLIIETRTIDAGSTVTVMPSSPAPAAPGIAEPDIVAWGARIGDRFGALVERARRPMQPPINTGACARRGGSRKRAQRNA